MLTTEQKIALVESTEYYTLDDSPELSQYTFAESAECARDGVSKEVECLTLADTEYRDKSLYGCMLCAATSVLRDDRRIKPDAPEIVEAIAAIRDELNKTLFWTNIDAYVEFVGKEKPDGVGVFFQLQPLFAMTLHRLTQMQKTATDKAAMPAKEKEHLRALIAECIGVKADVVKDDTDIRIVLEADEVDIAEICMAVEDEFDIFIPMEKEPDLQTLNDFAALVVNNNPYDAGNPEETQ